MTGVYKNGARISGLALVDLPDYELLFRHFVLPVISCPSMGQAPGRKGELADLRLSLPLRARPEGRNDVEQFSVALTRRLLREWIARVSRFLVVATYPFHGRVLYKSEIEVFEV
jgi:hypothetical protein